MQQSMEARTIFFRFYGLGLPALAADACTRSI